MGVPLHTVAARVKSAGYVHSHRPRVQPQELPRKPVEHYGTGDNAVVHRGILVGKREVVIQAVDYLHRLAVLDRAPCLGLLRPGIYRLKHCFCYARKSRFFTHILPPLLVFPPL